MSRNARDGDLNPIIVADSGLRCEHCDETFDPDEAVTATFPGLSDLHRCPYCSEWTEGPPPPE